MRPTSRFVLAYVTRESLNLKLDACTLETALIRIAVTLDTLSGAHIPRTRPNENRRTVKGGGTRGAPKTLRWDMRRTFMYTVQPQIRAEEIIGPMQLQTQAIALDRHLCSVQNPMDSIRPHIKVPG